MVEIPLETVSTGKNMKRRLYAIRVLVTPLSPILEQFIPWYNSITQTSIFSCGLRYKAFFLARMHPLHSSSRQLGKNYLDKKAEGGMLHQTYFPKYPRILKSYSFKSYYVASSSTGSRCTGTHCQLPDIGQKENK